MDRFWERWSRGVLRRPALPVCGGMLLVALCAPQLRALRVRNPRHEVIPPEVEARRGLARVLEVAGEGDLYPIVVVLRAEDGVTFRDAERQRRFLGLLERVRGWPEVGKVLSADMLMMLVPALLRFLGWRAWWWPFSAAPPPGGVLRTSG